MSISFWIGASFATAGFSLFVAQVLTLELIRSYKKLKNSIEMQFGHDTSVYPDYMP